MICLLDTNRQLSMLRQKLHWAFPGCPTQQTTIAYVSLLRFFTSQQVSTDDRQKLQAVCGDYTKQLKGLKFTAHELW